MRINMLKVALIVPQGSKYGKNPYLKHFLEKNDVVSNFYGAWETPNLSLLTIAGVLPDSCEISFIDEDHGQQVPFGNDFDIVAITGMTQQINRAYEICNAFKQRGVYVVIGGIHASIMPEEAGLYADTVMVGEGENIWTEFLDDFLHKRPKRKYTSNAYVNLSESPTPRYDILDKSLYKSYSVQTTRGCPRTCNYCTLPIMYGNTYRHKTIEQVVKEIKAIQNVDANPFVFFADDNMFIQKDYSKLLVKELEKLNIMWGTQTDISVAYDDELLKMLYNSGCHWLFIGFENVSKKGLNFLDNQKWKASQLDNYERSIESIHNRGLNIWGSFMFGGDHDTPSVFEETLEFALNNGIYSGSFTILTPLPGTEFFNQMVVNKRIIDFDWSRYTFWDTVFKPALMSSEELTKGVAWVYEQFYSNKNVADRTRRIRERIRRLKSQCSK